MNLENIMTVAQMAEVSPAFTEQKLRWWIFHAKRNGFARCIMKVEGRIYIDQVAFLEWLDSHRVEVIDAGSDHKIETANT